jgi:hypothetical protein
MARTRLMEYRPVKDDIVAESSQARPGETICACFHELGVTSMSMPAAAYLKVLLAPGNVTRRLGTFIRIHHKR